MGLRYKVFDSATVDAATATAKAKVLDWGTKLIFIKNNHATNGISYQINAEADSRDTVDSSHTLLAYTTLAAGKTIIYKTTDPWDTLYVNVKNAVGSSHASAVIWINGGMGV